MSLRRSNFRGWRRRSVPHARSAERARRRWMGAGGEPGSPFGMQPAGVRRTFTSESFDGEVNFPKI